MLEVRLRSSTEVVERALVMKESGFGRAGLDCVDGTSWSSVVGRAMPVKLRASLLGRRGLEWVLVTS